MKYTINVEFDSDWILSHRNDDELPVETLIKGLKNCKLSNTKSSFTTLIADVDEGVVPKNAFESIILQVLLKEYPEENVKDAFTLTIEGAAAEKDEVAVTDEKDEEQDELQSKSESAAKSLEWLLGSADSAKSKEVPKKEAGDVGADVMEKIEKLVGAAEFKALAKEISAISSEIQRNNTYDIFTYQSYLFAVNDGYGLSTYLNFLGRLVSGVGIKKLRATKPVMEFKIGPVKESMDPFNDVLEVLEDGDRRAVRILCIDVSEWMNNTESRFFKEFLRCIEKSIDGFIVIFRIPFVDKDVLEKIRFSLNDLLYVKTVTFPPFTKEEMQSFAQLEIEKNGFTLADEAWELFHKRLTEEKSDGKFYGLNTVKKVVRELLYKKQLDNAFVGKKENNISKDDAKLLCLNYGDDEITGMEMLDRLVACQPVKDKLMEILAQIDISMKLKPSERPCIHMRFVGNPGTGKTTVARILGKILKERGVLRVGNFYEYAGRDFCGKYIGETAPKTASMCRDAYGSVLFIDEAYSLYRGDDNPKDYGREAIDTLIAEMENHRTDLVIIMAGYTDDMQTLMEANFGLASRMPYVLEFPNFTREQLAEIYKSMLTNKFDYEKGVLKAAEKYFKSIPEEFISSKNFSNARFVRNLFERTWAKAALRCQLDKTEVIKITVDDFERASCDKEFTFNEKKKTKIGF